MGILGLIAVALPQLLLLLLAGGHFDLLGGLNHTDTGMGLLIVLFVAAPVVALTWFLALALAVANGLGRARSKPRRPPLMSNARQRKANRIGSPSGSAPCGVNRTAATPQSGEKAINTWFRSLLSRWSLSSAFFCC